MPEKGTFLLCSDKSRSRAVGQIGRAKPILRAVEIPLLLTRFRADIDDR